MRQPQLTHRRLFRGRGLAALSLAAAALVVGATPARAVSRAPLVVRAGHPAQASYGAAESRAPLDAGLSLFEVDQQAPAFPPPGDCAQAGCDLFPIDVEPPAPGMENMLAVSATWSPQDTAGTVTGLERIPGLWLALWDRGPDGTYRRLDADAGRGGAGQAVVRLETPHRGRYWLTLRGNPYGDQLTYTVRAEFEFPTSWAVDAAGTGAASAVQTQAGARALDAAPSFAVATTTTANGRGDPLGGDRRLTGLQALAARARHASTAAGVSAWWWVVRIALVVVGVVGALRALRRRGGGAVIAGVRRRFGDLRLFWKLLVPFAAALLVIGMAGAFLTTRYLASNANTTVNRTLVQRSVTTDSYVRDQEVNLLEAERFAANLQGVPDATAAGDRAGLATALASAVAVNKGLDVVAVTDLAGRGLVEFTAQETGFSPHSGADWSPATAVREVLAGAVDAAGDKHVSFVRLTDGTVLLVTAGPVRTDRVVGAAVAGISLDKLAAGAAAAARTQVGVYNTTGHLLGASRGKAMPSRLAPSLTGATPMRQRGGRYATAFAPLVIRGIPVGTVATRISESSAYAPVRGAAIRVAVLVALAMAAVIGFGALVSRYIVSNVESLVATNRALGSGDLSVRAPIRSGDELGELATGFNQMAEQLEASYAELERRVAERTEELSRLYDDNLKASETRTQFFASVSHEFRTPLFAILANVELLNEPALGPPDPAELAEGLTTIDASAKVLLDRVNEILDLARAETTGVDLELAEVSIPELWDELAPTVGALARAAELTVSTDVYPELPAVRADPARLRQILLNVISNAIKYTPAGGSVGVTAAPDGESAQFTITDTGAGIPKSVGDKVFEPYYRVKGSRAQGRWASTGLGLALTKRLVEAHGGRIWFESSRRGTTFHISMPTVATKTAPTRQRASKR